METHRDDHGGRQALRFASSPRQHRSDRFPHASKNSCPCWQQTAGRGQYFAFSLSWYHRVPSRFSRVSSRTSIRTRVSPGTRCLLVSDTDEAALLSNLRPWLAGPASKRSRRDARYPSALRSVLRIKLQPLEASMRRLGESSTFSRWVIPHSNRLPFWWVAGSQSICELGKGVAQCWPAGEAEAGSAGEQPAKE